MSWLKNLAAFTPRQQGHSLRTHQLYTNMRKQSENFILTFFKSGHYGNQGRCPPGASGYSPSLLQRSTAGKGEPGLFRAGRDIASVVISKFELCIFSKKKVLIQSYENFVLRKHTPGTQALNRVIYNTLEMGFIQLMNICFSRKNISESIFLTIATGFARASPLGPSSSQSKRRWGSQSTN